MNRLYLVTTLALSLSFSTLVAPSVSAQAPSPALPATRDLSAVELKRLVDGITVSPRVLVVGMHPDDEPSELLAWLSRGRRFETAYLSITRGEAGQNVTGTETGSTLGALRVQEALAARRIDGAQQFFTRAFDFGTARNAADVFQTWVRDSIVADVVTVIRAFRPQIMISVFPDSVTDGNGQHMALATILDHAFTSSADPRRFPAKSFGAPWPVAKLYRQGPGLTIETAEFDRALGMTYAELGLLARAQQRTQGLPDVPRLPPTEFRLERMATRVNGDRADSSFFDAIDTSLMRFSHGIATRDSAALIRFIVAADSARHSLDMAQPSAIVPYLTTAVAALNDLRLRAPRCRHPSRDARPAPDSAVARCDPKALDYEASLDIARQRATDALLAAAGVVVQTNADRELIAASDTASVMVTVSNRGTRPFAIFDVSLLGMPEVQVPGPGHAVTLSPDSTARFFIRVSKLEQPGLWWIGSKTAEQYEGTLASADGLLRGTTPVGGAIPGIAVPDNLRRTSDVRLMLDVAGTTVQTSFGPVIYRYADGELGLQHRQLAGVPDVAIRFNRALTWVPLNKPFSRVLRVGAKSFTDKPLRMGIGKLAPEGLLVDSIPRELSLEGREQRDLAVPIRGKLTDARRKPFAIWGALENGTTYQQGFQEVERDYLSPVRVFRTSGVWVQPVDITVPPALTVFYTPELSDDIRSALTEIGVQAREISPEGLLMADLSRVTSIAIGARALERYPELEAQSGRLMRWVRAGGTLVIQRGGAITASSLLMPYPMTLSRPGEKVAHPDAPVTILDRASRIVSWPNRITDDDFGGWISGRAQGVPTTADARWSKVIETHDPGEQENRNTILVARLGKGTVVYTTLTLDEQIAGGVPGALRLMVNLLSAGLPR